MHFPTHLILELWRYADFSILIAGLRFLERRQGGR
jgi:hypothetical protein